jgi:hypothetical protein
MSSTAWLTRRSVSLGLSEHSPARSHRSERRSSTRSRRSLRAGRIDLPAMPSRRCPPAPSRRSHRAPVTAAQIDSEDDHFLAFLRSVASTGECARQGGCSGCEGGAVIRSERERPGIRCSSKACLLVGDIKALRALLAALGCIEAVFDTRRVTPNSLNLSANGVPGTLKQRIRAAASLYRAAQHYAATPRADAERPVPAPAREERGGTPSRRGWLPDRRRVHDHVRDGRDGGYGVVLHLRDKEVDG